MQVLALLFAAAFLVLPVVALLVALNALSRLKTRLPGSIGGHLESLDLQIKALERQVRRLTARLAELEGGAPAAPDRPAPEPMPEPNPEPMPEPTPEPAPHATPERESAPELAPPVVPAAALAPPVPPAATLEERIGGRWATWAAIVVLVFVVGLCFREVFSRNLIGFAARVAIGLAAGLGMAAGGLAIRRRKTLPYLSLGLTGGGLAILYLSLFAGFNLYHLFSAEVGFAGMFAVTVGGSTIAVLTGQRPIAVLAVTGGLLTPILAHGERTDERILIGYLIVLDLVALAISRWRSWPGLNRLAWLGSALLLAPVIGRAHAAPYPEARLLLLTALFGVFVAIPVLRVWLDRAGSEPFDLMLVVSNGALYFAVVYVTLEAWHPAFEGPWALALAAGYVAVAMFHHERVGGDDVAVTVHYGAAAVLAALAFPLMLDGPWVTLAWAAQAVVFVVIAPRLPRRAVALVGAVALFAGAIARAAYLDRFWYPPETRIVNVTFAVGLLVVVALAVAGYLAARVSKAGVQLRSTFWVAASLLLAALLWREPTGVWPGVWLTIEVVALAFAARLQGDRAFRTGAVLVAALVFARLYVWDARKAAVAAAALLNGWFFLRVGSAFAVAYAGETLRRADDAGPDRGVGRGLLGLAWLELLAALSLGWFLHMDPRVHEEASASLGWRMQLGLSALWAVYAGISLALGLAWSHVALRYAGLALLGVTIAKVFLIDLSEVQTIWRILSFLVLGLVLLGVSVLYQRRLR
jgi:uncharacterized membrane protein